MLTPAEHLAGKPTSCFVHVPKCGGSALTRHLQTILGEDHVFHVDGGRYGTGPVTPLLNRYPVVTGHFTLAQIPEPIFDTTFLFTFLREPIDRILSLYYFLRESQEDQVPEVAEAKSHDLLSIFPEAGPARISTWANWQTFLFSGAADLGHSAEELLPAALRNLERFDFVGIYEVYREGVQRLGEMRGWPLTEVVPPFKVTRARPAVAEVDPALAARILENNACDARLHERARELWKRTKTVPVALAVSASPEDAATVAASPPSRTGRFQPAERGTREIVVTGINIHDRRAGTSGTVEQGTPLEIEIHLHSAINDDGAIVGIRITDELGAEIYGVNTRILGHPFTVVAGEDLLLRFVCTTPIAAGGYYLTVAAHSGEDHLYKTYHWMDYAAAFHVTRNGPAAFGGLVDLKAQLAVESSRAAA